MLAHLGDSELRLAKPLAAFEEEGTGHDADREGARLAGEIALAVASAYGWP